MNKNNHTHDDQILGYILRTLSDADREVINHHLLTCQICRARVSQHEIQQRQISNSLRAEINGAAIPARLSFSAIAPKLDLRRASRFWSKISSVAPLATAIIGFSLAAFGLWLTLVEWNSILTLPSPNATFPTLACFFLMFVSMDQFDRSLSIRPRFILTLLVASLLWLGTFIIGLLNLVVITDLVIAGYLAVGGEPAGASVMAILAVILAAMVYIGVVIGGAEYHFRNIGQPGSWKLFSWTIFVQLFIMVLPYFLL